jgi:hypothetical protein
VKPLYGFAAAKVELINAAELTPLDTMIPYNRQMYLKILISNYVTGDAYCILDSKNYFHFPLKNYHVFENKKLRLCMYPAETRQFFHEQLENSFRVFGLITPNWVFSLNTPFFAYTGIIQQISNLPNLHEWFKSGTVTEFYLIQAFMSLADVKLEEIYYPVKASSVLIDQHSKMNQILNEDFGQTKICVSLHPQIFKNLTDETVEVLKSHWTKLDLINTDNLIEEMRQRLH